MTIHDALDLRTLGGQQSVDSLQEPPLPFAGVANRADSDDTEHVYALYAPGNAGDHKIHGNERQ